MFGASGAPSGEAPGYSQVPLPSPRFYRPGMNNAPVPGGVVPNDFASDAVTSAPLQALAMSPVGRGLLYGLIGTAVGKKAGDYLFPNSGGLGGYIAAILGGGVGGYGGFRGKKLNIPGPAGAFGRLFQSEEPAVVPGAAREMAGGTAATTADTGITGGQAGPSQVRNAAELSSHVQRVRSGTPASSPSIYTPESLASEQGMSTAALGKGGFNLTIPPEQQHIMDLVAKGKVPMGRPTPFPGPPRPNTPTVASTAQPGFSGLQTSTPAATQLRPEVQELVKPGEASVSQPALVQQMQNAVANGTPEKKAMALQRLREMGVKLLERFR
jgi:hypothetical protein